MLRINHSALSLKKGKYIFNESPYTGISLRFVNGFLKEKYEFYDGLKKRLCNDQVIPHSDLIEVHMEETLIMADFAEVAYYINGDEHTGEEFTGYAYSFEGDYCTSEYLIEKSWPDSAIWYDKLGEIIFIKYTDDSKEFLNQKVKYNENNHLFELEVKLAVNIGFSIKFDENNLFSIFSLKGDFFNECRRQFSDIIIPVFENKETITYYTGAERVFLSDDGIDEEMMIVLLENNLLIKVKELVIWRDVFFEKSIFNLLIRHTNLTRLDIETDNADKTELIELKKRMPNCEITYFRKKL